MAAHLNCARAAGLAALAALLPAGAAPAQKAPPKFDLSREKVLYTVSTAHLDTQWRWTIQDTINRYIPDTLRGQFALMDQYPDYVFSFEGAFRYKLAREYYPAEFARLKREIAAGRWRVTGASVDAGDVNIASPESVMRHVLYGNGYFRDEFGVTSRDIFLPDCFGFGYALPTIARHCGVLGFSTQKLGWGSSIGTPFDIGQWQGVDGSVIVAAVRPESYTSKLDHDLSTDSRWLDTIVKQGEQSGVYAGFKYIGVGDRGGAPTAETVGNLEAGVKGSGPVTVYNTGADQLFRDLTPAQVARLPKYDGELLLKTHGTGCYTSQAAMKRWNRKNELLADAAERASVAADWLGGAPYPKAKLDEAWWRFLWHQFHDDLTGTSIPQAYQFSWNDELLSLNQFQSVLNDAGGAVARAMDTRVSGVPVVVYNPLSIERTDVVEAAMPMAARAVRVVGPDGRETPAQASGGKVAFLASVPANGYAVYDVRPAAVAAKSTLRVTKGSLENARYRVRLDANGDLASVFDKLAGKELLSAAARVELLPDRSTSWPAWEVTYNDVAAAPKGFAGEEKAAVVESGPARVAVEVARTVGGSRIVQRYSLAAGAAGDSLKIENAVDWKTQGGLLKAAFPLTASSAQATYDLGLGTIRRGNNRADLYEVPAQQWADLTSSNGRFGAAIFSDSKYGWDKPSDNTLRLTLIHTPETGRGYRDQSTLDLGHHRFTYAIAGHKGDWRQGRVAWQAARLNQPLVAFVAPKHAGPLGKTFAFATVSTPNVMVKALKNAEKGREVVVRLVELAGKPAAGVAVRFAAPIVSAREVNGAEEPVGPAVVKGGALVTSFHGYQPRTFAVRLGAAPARLSVAKSAVVPLPYNTDAVSANGESEGGRMDAAGHAIAGDLFPKALSLEGIRFALGSAKPGAKNAVACTGQKIALKPGGLKRVYILAASSKGDRKATFLVGGKPVSVTVRDVSQHIGQWDNRRLDERGQPVGPSAIDPGYLKTDAVAWVGTHRHDSAGAPLAYEFTYLFKYACDLPAGATSITLPKDPSVKVFAVSLGDNPNEAATRVTSAAL